MVTSTLSVVSDAKPPASGLCVSLLVAHCVELMLTVPGSFCKDVLISHPDYTTAKRDANAGGKLLHSFAPPRELYSVRHELDD